METWPTILPQWRVEYSSEYSNAVARSVFNGIKEQRRISQRNSEIVNVTLTLHGVQILIFEYFVQELLNEGQDFFTADYVADGQVKTGSVRIVGGAYTVSAITGRDWRVDCQIEVQRA